MKQWEKIIATACVGTGLLWMGTVLPAQAAQPDGPFLPASHAAQAEFSRRGVPG